MKTFHRVVSAAVVVALAAAFAAGCGRAREAVETAREVGEAARFARDMQDGQATVKTDDGEAEVTVDKDGEQVTMTKTDKEGRESTFTVGKDADLSDLGVAVYPGATQEMSTKTTGADGGGMTVVLSTTDPFDKVADFYRDKYPDAPTHETTSGEANMLMLHVSEEPSRAVTISRGGEEDKTGITIVSENP